MKQVFDVTTTSRKMISTFFENYSLAQLNTIPPGFNNNLIWNIGHIIVSQQILVYKLSGLPLLVSNELVEKYMKGTRPETDVSQVEVDEIKHLLTHTLQQTQADFEQNRFQNYTPYTTSTGGHVLNNALDAMAFSNFHEGVHIGCMLMIRKFI